MENKEIILEVMKKEGKPMCAGQIVESTGLDKKIVDKEMKILKDENKIESPKRCFWQPK